MAVEIGASESGARVSLTGRDADHFLDEVMNPSADVRRLEHLEHSDKTFALIYSPEPIHDLPNGE